MVFKVRLLDSSFLVAFFIPEDARHAKAVEIYLNTDDELQIPYEILTEMLTVVNNKKGIKITSEILERLKQNKQFAAKEPISQEFHADALAYFLGQRSDQHLSYIDSILIVLTKNSSAGVITFDSKIFKALK